LNPNSWTNAVKDIDIVLHIASPLPIAPPTDENDVIRPALEGTLNVLNVAFNANVKRFVYTSSGLTLMSYGYEKGTYSEEDWIDSNDAKTAYQKSKILTERAVWNFVNEKKKINQKCFDLAVVVPVFVLG
jgi:dihydroflavonol-4-reductase